MDESLSIKSRHQYAQSGNHLFPWSKLHYSLHWLNLSTILILRHSWNLSLLNSPQFNHFSPLTTQHSFSTKDKHQYGCISFIPLEFSISKVSINNHIRLHKFYDNSTMQPSPGSMSFKVILSIYDHEIYDHNNSFQWI